MTRSALTPPAGLFIVIGAAFVLTWLADVVLGQFAIEVGGAVLGTDPRNGYGGYREPVTIGVSFVLLGIIMHLVARISARMSALAKASGGTQ